MSGTDAFGTALAARCTACGTVFRVVPDQLRVSAGWVRCGRCAAVFNAAHNLIDLESGGPRRLDLGIDISSRPPMTAFQPPPPPRAIPPPQPTSPAAPSPLAAHVRRPAQDPRLSATAKRLALGTGEPEAEPLQPPEPRPVRTGRARHAPKPEVAPQPAARGSAKAPQPPHAPPPWFEALASAAPQTASNPPLSPPTSANSPASPAAPLPSFVRRADRAARWNKPHVRAALAIGVVLSALLLTTQVAVVYRDAVAARWPELRPLLLALCQPLACQVNPPRSIADLTVESSALVRVEGSEDAYQLNVALRNRADVALALPALELSLTDAQGRLLSRRVLLASDLGITQPTVVAGGDLAMQTTLRTAPQSTNDGPGSERAAIVGYTIELFYP